MIGGLVLAAVNTFLAGLLTVDDADSFYEQRIRRLAQRNPFPSANSAENGLLVMEIDGLSYRHMEQALALGYMPTLQTMIDEWGLRAVADRLRPAVPDIVRPGRHSLRR